MLSTLSVLTLESLATPVGGDHGWTVIILTTKLRRCFKTMWQRMSFSPHSWATAPSIVSACVHHDFMLSSHDACTCLAFIASGTHAISSLPPFWSFPAQILSNDACCTCPMTCRVDWAASIQRANKPVSVSNTCGHEPMILNSLRPPQVSQIDQGEIGTLIDCHTEHSGLLYTCKLTKQRRNGHWLCNKVQFMWEEFLPI